MTFARNLLSPWRALVAVAALAAGAMPAQAGLTLNYSGPDGTATKSGTIDFANGANTGLGANTQVNPAQTGSIVFSGYTFTYSVSSSYTLATQTQVITLSGILAANVGATPSQGAFTFNLLGGSYNFPASGVGIQTSSLSASFVGANSNTGVSTTPSYTNSISMGTPMFNDAGLMIVNTNDPTTKTNIRSVGPLTGPYGLALFNSTFSGVGANSSVTFSATTQITALPEPASIAAALSGLPCVGGVLAMARRRLRRNAVAA